MYRKFVKRILDIFLSFILIILLSPIMFIVMCITLIDLGLPLHNLLREREGMYKKTFIMYKFRTKVLDPDGTTKSSTYTKVSSFLDKTRLNELPQLFNVLLGQMSLVGPRPFIPGESDQFKGRISEKRYLVRPGITGLAQISGGREITNKKKFECDVEYYDNLSFLLDLKIVLITIGQVFCVDVDKIRKKKEKENI